MLSKFWYTIQMIVWIKTLSIFLYVLFLSFFFQVRGGPSGPADMIFVRVATNGGGTPVWEEVVPIAWIINGNTEDIVTIFTLQRVILQAGFGAVAVYVNAIKFVNAFALELTLAVVLWLVILNIP